MLAAVVVAGATYLAERNLRIGRDLIFHSTDVQGFVLPNGEAVTGFILFVTYEEDLDGKHVVAEPKLYFWPWGTYEEEVVLSPEAVTTRAEELEARKAAAANAESGAP